MERNPYSWTQHFDVLFVDNPVGTGYSYVDPPAKVVLTFDEYTDFLVSLSALEKRHLMYGQEDEDSGQLFLQSPSELPISPGSTTDSAYDQGYATNQDGVARDMLTFLHKFYENFPEKREADLYLASESYGGSISLCVCDNC